MRLFRLLPLALLAVLALPSFAQAADVPSNKTLYADGPSGRYLVDGQWLFRLDAADQGVRQRFYRQSSTTGWSRVTVPNVWNVGDDSEASMRGSVGWYRKDFELPDKKAALEWAMRFESGSFQPNAEVDELRWMPPAAAHDLLTYPHDREVLAAL